MPEIKLISLKEEYQKKTMQSIFSSPLIQSIEESLSTGEQVILFQNRRGFSLLISCDNCNWIPQCVQCDVSLVYHKKQNHLRCHYCGYTAASPSYCPDCGAAALHFGGTGTEKIAAEVLRLFPAARVARMDSDTMKTRQDYLDALGGFGRGEVDVLVGTQMIAKGLDFPNLTLVGIVSADTGLIDADFRAAERSFQLIEQVSGRTGRTKSGYVVLQTHAPETACILRAAAHDYAGFAAGELAAREAAGYPPFGRLIRVVASGADVRAVQERIAALAETLRAALAGRGRVLGPVEAPISRLQGRWRRQLMVKLPPDVSAGILRGPLQNRSTRQGVTLAVDVDPYEML